MPALHALPLQRIPGSPLPASKLVALGDRRPAPHTQTQRSTKEAPARLARDGVGTRSLVRPAAVVGRAREAVDVGRDAGVVRLVGAREADGRRRREGAALGDVDLRARLVELRLVRLVGAVQRQRLSAQEVLARGDAAGQLKVDPALVLEHRVDAPCLAGHVKALLPDLEPVVVCQLGGGVGKGGQYVPLEPRHARRGSIVNLGEVCHHGPFVRLCDGVVRIVGKLCASDDMPPVHAQLITARDADDGLGLAPARAADHVLAADILDWVVVVGRPHACELPLVLAVDREFLRRVR